MTFVVVAKVVSCKVVVHFAKVNVYLTVYAPRQLSTTSLTIQAV